MKHASTQMLVLDVDGTLVGERQRIDQGVKNAINALADAGWVVALASGRRLHMLDELQSELLLDGVISSEGATITWHGVEEQVARFSHYEWTRLAQFAHDHGFSPMVCSERDTIIEELTPAIVRASSFGGQTPISRNFDIASDFDAALVLLVTDPGLAIDHYAEQLSEEFHTSASVSAPGFISVAPENVSKGSSLARVINQHFGGDIGVLVAAGDSLNDLSLLQMADQRIVMPHAPQSLLSMATEIADSVDATGLRASLEGLLCY